MMTAWRLRFPDLSPHLTKSCLAPHMSQFILEHLPGSPPPEAACSLCGEVVLRWSITKRKITAGNVASTIALSLLMAGTPTSSDSNQRRTGCQVVEVQLRNRELYKCLALPYIPSATYGNLRLAKERLVLGFQYLMLVGNDSSVTCYTSEIKLNATHSSGCSYAIAEMNRKWGKHRGKLQNETVTSWMYFQHSDIDFFFKRLSFTSSILFNSYGTRKITLCEMVAITITEQDQAAQKPCLAVAGL